MDELAIEFKEALLSLDRIKALELLAGECKTGNPVECLEKVVVPVLEEIGDDWEEGRLALTQVYMGGRICEDVLNAVLPKDIKQVKEHPKMAIAVLQDYHLLGKRIVLSVLRAGGYGILDYGAGITVEDLVNNVEEDGIEILLISALMLNSALLVGELVKRLKQTGSKTKVIVGGAPFRFDEKLWQEVGADAMASNASGAFRVVERIIKEVGNE